MSAEHTHQAELETEDFENLDLAIDRESVVIAAGIAVGGIAGVILSRYGVPAGEDPEDIFAISSGFIGAGAGAWAADKINSALSR